MPSLLSAPLGRQLWVGFGGTAPVVFDPIYPWTFLRRFASSSPREFGSHGDTVAYVVARRLVRDEPPLRSLDYQRNWGAAAMWLTRNRDASDAVAYLAEAVYVGPDMVGVSSAAKALFDKPIASLDLSETALVAALVRRQGICPAWCDPDAPEKARRFIIGRMRDEQLVRPEEAAVALHEIPALRPVASSCRCPVRE
jgi:hypothetical protein